MITKNALVNVNHDFINYLHLINGVLGNIDRSTKINNLKNEVRAKGRALGREEGRIEANIEIAVKMKNAGWPLSEIAELTELSADEIEELGMRDER